MIPVSGTSEVAVIGLFPLDAILVPGLVFPMHIFEPRYQQLLREVLAQPEPEREFGIVALRPVADSDGNRWHSVGTTALVTDVDAYPDGRSDITTVGHRRFEILEVISQQPYVQAKVRWLSEDSGDVDETAESVAALRAAAVFAHYRRQLGAEETDLSDLPDEPSMMSYVLTAAIIAPTPARQILLEAPSTTTRLALACELMLREIAMMKILRSIPLSAQAPDSAQWN